LDLIRLRIDQGVRWPVGKPSVALELPGRTCYADGDRHAAALFGQALGLWRGDAFAMLDTPWLNTVRCGRQAEALEA
jgi:hypothetical protein